MFLFMITIHLCILALDPELLRSSKENDVNGERREGAAKYMRLHSRYLYLVQLGMGGR